MNLCARPANSHLPCMHCGRDLPRRWRSREREFESAARQFEALSGEDPVSRIFMERAQGFALRPPSEDWDGVHNLESK